MKKEYRKVEVDTSTGKYDVIIGENLDVGELLAGIHEACHVLLVSDDTVFSLYGDETAESFRKAGYRVDTFVFEHGEKSKNLDTLGSILEYAGDLRLTRTDLMVALGGGVTGDITGFASAVYLRGIDFVQIPTTVLAAVDSSVGGKTAVDLTAGKNLAGAFHQPIGVFLDVTKFASLPEETFSEGLSEAVKAGLIRDRELFEIFENNDTAASGGENSSNYGRFSLDMVDICSRCIEIKAEVVHIDEFDTGLRQILNFGHTPAHAIEILSGMSISHGQAVAIGMVIMTKKSEMLGKLPEGTTARVKKVLEKYKLPTECSYSAKELAGLGAVDKKRTGKTQGIVLLNAIGDAYVEKIPAEQLAEYLSV